MKKVEKKKKAFTLIELLAVIVILAIIALIATPIIGKLVDRARKEAFKESAVGVIRAGENYMGKYILKNHADPSFPIVFVCNGTECTNGEEALDIAGKVPKSGSIILENHKSIKAEYLSDGKYCVAGVKSNLQVANSCADIDVTKPTVSALYDTMVITINMVDNESGIAAYCVTVADDFDNCDWVTTSTSSVEHELSTPGTYYVFAKDQKGNVSESSSIYADESTFVLAPGVYDVNGNLTYTWQQLLELGLDITIDYTSSNYTNATSGYSVLKNNNISGKLVIPASIRKIGNYAFYGSTNITDLVIYSEQIGEAAFYKTSVQNITFGAGVLSLDKWSFGYTNVLETVMFSDALETIGDYAFAYSSAPSIQFSNGIIEIGNYAFMGASILELTIPSSVTNMGTMAFASNKVLKKVTINNAVLSPSQMFEGCSSLEEVIINGNVKTIPQYAFSYTPNLKKIIIPISVVQISTGAFQSSGLTSVTFEDISDWAICGSNADGVCNSKRYVSSLTASQIAYELSSASNYWSNNGRTDN